VAILADIGLVLWFFLPAGVANMVPVLVAPVPGLRQWNAPIDGGREYRGRRIFGDHKTWRGLVTGMVASTLVFWLQQWLVVHTGWGAALAGQIDYAHLPVLIVGPLLGFGALAGDAIESFFKRQRQVAPGRSWFPFDQIDYVVGGVLVALPFVRLTVWHYVLLLVFWLGIHMVVSFIGFKMHLKERPI